MEGPSLLILKEDMERFAGSIVIDAHGSSRIDFNLLKNQKITSISSWGKHFLIAFKKFTIRVHFLMFGSYRINERKAPTPRLCLKLNTSDEINFYATAISIIHEDLNSVYDWSADVLNNEWDRNKARRKLKKLSNLNVGDALLDQNIFSGVGNIIKNEVLFRIQVHPESVVHALPPRKLSEMIDQARAYSFDFYKWKKEFQLKKHWLIYTRKKCPRCKIPSLKTYTGKTKRQSFYCSNCQKLYV